MGERNGLSGNIILSTSVFFLFQVCLYAVMLQIAGGTIMESLLFIPVSLLIHVILAVFLIAMKNAFVIEKTGRKLDHINSANLLTMVRISSTPTLMFLLLQSRTLNLLPVIIIMMGCIFITDALDGLISRLTNQITRMGKMLDSISDYTILFHIAIALVWLEYLPFWYFVLLLIRLFFQAIGQLTFLIARGKVEPAATFLGKAAVASAMILFGCEIFRAVWLSYPAMIYRWIEMLAGLIIFASIIDKVIVFAKQAGIPSSRRQTGLLE